ncbi:MAG: hypothetical protein HY762_06760 [Planctomycetes bacterium]|nr:hypothetical protein [Planctomycetota bacterium]
MGSEGLIVFIFIAFIILIFVMLWITTPLERRISPDKTQLETIELCSFPEQLEAEGVREFLAERGVSSSVERLGLGRRGGCRYVITELLRNGKETTQRVSF